MKLKHIEGWVRIEALNAKVSTMESEGLRLRIYVNKRKKLILAPEVFEKYGGVSNETIQIKNGEFSKEIEKEVNEAMQEIIDRWQPIFDNISTEALFAERQRQVKNFIDFETVLTDLVEKEFSSDEWRMAKKIAEIKSKPIAQYTLDGKLVKVWPSPTEVHRQLGINQGNISAVARGERNKASGFIWKYV